MPNYLDIFKNFPGNSDTYLFQEYLCHIAAATKYEVGRIFQDPTAKKTQSRNFLDFQNSSCSWAKDSQTGCIHKSAQEVKITTKDNATEWDVVLLFILVKDNTYLLRRR